MYKYHAVVFAHSLATRFIRKVQRQRLLSHNESTSLPYMLGQQIIPPGQAHMRLCDPTLSELIRLFFR